MTRQSVPTSSLWLLPGTGGVPTIVYNGEPFFGHDRVETLLWRIAQTE